MPRYILWPITTLSSTNHLTHNHFFETVFGGGGKYMLEVMAASSAFAAALSKPGLEGLRGNSVLLGEKGGDLGAFGVLK